MKMPQIVDFIDPLKFYRGSSDSQFENKNPFVLKRLKQEEPFITKSRVDLSSLYLKNEDLRLLAPLILLTETTDLVIDSAHVTGEGLLLFSKICKHFGLFKDISSSTQRVALTNCNELSEQGVVALMGVNPFKEISIVDLSNSPLGEKSDNSLIKMINVSLVESLDLSSSQVCPSLALTSKMLVKLNLAHNKLSAHFLMETLH